MDWLGWIANNGWVLVERGVFAASFLFAAFSLRANTRERRLQNLQTFTDRHQEVLSKLLSEPRILDAGIDAVSPTQQEIHAVNFLLLHLKSAYEAHDAGMYRLPENVHADIQLLFSYPIPRTVWAEVKDMHDREFVAFVERARAGAAKPRARWWRRDAR